MDIRLDGYGTDAAHLGCRAGPTTPRRSVVLARDSSAEAALHAVHELQQQMAEHVRPRTHAALAPLRTAG